MEQESTVEEAKAIARMDPRHALITVLLIAISALVSAVGTMWYLDRADRKKELAAQVACQAEIAANERACSDRIAEVERFWQDKFNGFLLTRLNRLEHVEDVADSAIQTMTRTLKRVRKNTP